MVVKSFQFKLPLIGKKIVTVLFLNMPLVLMALDYESSLSNFSCLNNAELKRTDTIDYVYINLDCHYPEDLQKFKSEFSFAKGTVIKLLEIHVNEEYYDGCRQERGHLRKPLAYLKKQLSKVSILELEIEWEGRSKYFKELVGAINMDQLEYLELEIEIEESFELQALKAANLKKLAIISGISRRREKRDIIIPSRFFGHLTSLAEFEIIVYDKGPIDGNRNDSLTSHRILFSKQKYPCKAQKINISTTDSSEVQNLLNASPNVETLSLDYFGEVTLSHSQSLRKLHFNRTNKEMPSRYSLKDICHILPLGLEELVLPEFLTDTCLDSCLLRFKDLNALTISFPFKLVNPEILLELKKLKHLDISSYYGAKWTSIYNDTANKSGIIQFFNDCDCYEYFYRYRDSNVKFDRNIDDFVHVLEKLKLKSLYIDGECLFIMPDHLIEKLSAIPEIQVINHIRHPQLLIAIEKLYVERKRKQEFIYKTLPQATFHPNKFKFIP